MPFNWERAPIRTSAISVVLVAREAETTVAGVLEALLAQVEGLKREHEVLVVDDGSSDQTVAVVDAFVERKSKVRLLRHDKPQGYGAALRTGLAAAKHPLLLSLPADGGYQPADLPKLLNWIDQSDAVCGVRRPRPRFKVFGQRWLVRLLFGVQLTDPACHFRLYRKSVLERFPIQSRGCFADVEIAAKANFLECLLAEAEVAWQAPATRIRGPSFWSDVVRVWFGPQFSAPSV